jgi:hypothetical protein
MSRKTVIIVKFRVLEYIHVVLNIQALFGKKKIPANVNVSDVPSNCWRQIKNIRMELHIDGDLISYSKDGK